MYKHEVINEINLAAFTMAAAMGDMAKASDNIVSASKSIMRSFEKLCKVCFISLDGPPTEFHSTAVNERISQVLPVVSSVFNFLDKSPISSFSSINSDTVTKFATHDPVISVVVKDNMSLLSPHLPSIVTNNSSFVVKDNIPILSPQLPSIVTNNSSFVVKDNMPILSPQLPSIVTNNSTSISKVSKSLLQSLSEKGHSPLAFKNLIALNVNDVVSTSVPTVSSFDIRFPPILDSVSLPEESNSSNTNVFKDFSAPTFDSFSISDKSTTETSYDSHSRTVSQDLINSSNVATSCVSLVPLEKLMYPTENNKVSDSSTFCNSNMLFIPLKVNEGASTSGCNIQSGLRNKRKIFYDDDDVEVLLVKRKMLKSNPKSENQQLQKNTSIVASRTSCANSVYDEKVKKKSKKQMKRERQMEAKRQLNRGRQMEAKKQIKRERQMNAKMQLNIEKNLKNMPCVFCNKNLRNSILKCGHVDLCLECARKTSYCPTCKKPVYYMDI